MLQNYNGNTFIYIRFCSNIFHNEHKILKKCFILRNLCTEHCILFKKKKKKIYCFKNDRIWIYFFQTITYGISIELSQFLS
jgi:hypothetical protein